MESDFVSQLLQAVTQKKMAQEILQAPVHERARISIRNSEQADHHQQKQRTHLHKILNPWAESGNRVVKDEPIGYLLRCKASYLGEVSLQGR